MSYATFPVECRAWGALLQQPDCLQQGLVANGWKSNDDLNGTQGADLKNILINDIQKYLNASIHTSVDLSFR